MTPTEIRQELIDKFDLIPEEVTWDNSEIHPLILEAWYNPNSQTLDQALRLLDQAE